MKHERKIFWVIGFLAVIMFIAVGYLVAKTLFPEPNVPDDPNNNPEPKIEIQVILDNYTVYKLDDVSFPFVIARIEVSSEEDILMELSDLYTSEQLNLAQTQMHRDELAGLGYDLEEQRVEFELPSGSTSYAINVLIPIRQSDADKVILYSSKNSKVAITFDLSFANGTREMLGYKPDEYTFSDDETYRVEVKTFADITGFTVTRKLNNDESMEVVFPSTAKIFAVQLHVEALSSTPVVIESARYRIISDSQVSYAFDKEVSVEDYPNLIELEIRNFISGYVFFDLYSTELSLFDENSLFEIKLKQLDEWITIKIND